MKQCTRCKNLKPETDFYERKERKSGLQSWCKNCKKAHHYLKYDLKKYGLTAERYNEMLKSQFGRCFICLENEPRSGARLAVDHSHVTGRIRSLLCSRCNAAVGMLRESPMIAESVFLYVSSQREMETGK